MNLVEQKTIRNFDFWPGFVGALANDLFEKSSRRIRSATTSQSERVETNFHLIDTFTHDLVRAQVERPLDLTFERSERLTRTLKTQLEAALREHLRTPYHSDAYEIDWNKFGAGQLHVFHRSYHQRDIRDHCQDAINVSQGETRARYQREKDQMDKLYSELIVPQLERPETLTTARADSLSLEIRQAYQLNSDKSIYLGDKHCIVLPSNLEVYPDGYSYVNIHQLVYVPALEKILVTIDQFFAPMSDSELRTVLLGVGSKQDGPTLTSPRGGRSWEALLMSTVATLPESARTSPAFDIFLQTAQMLNESDLRYRQKQQRSYSFVSHSKETLNLAATFLTQVLLLEYQLCQQHPSALDSLASRLQVAFEMAAHPLLSGREFAYKASLSAYSDQLLSNWFVKKSQSAQSHQQLLDRLVENRTSPSRNRPKDNSIETQRNQALMQLSATYPNILNSFFSQAQCAVGSIGGLTKMRGALTSPLGTKILSGYNPSFSDLHQLIGERAQNFHRGKCINPDCQLMHGLSKKFGGNILENQLPYVGECDLCMSCELAHQASESLDSLSDINLDKLEQFSRQAFNSSSDVTSAYLREFGIQPSILPTYFLAERWVVH